MKRSFFVLAMIVAALFVSCTSTEQPTTTTEVDTTVVDSVSVVDTVAVQ